MPQGNADHGQQVSLMINGLQKSGPAMAGVAVRSPTIMFTIMIDLYIVNVQVNDTLQNYSKNYMQLFLTI